MGGTAATGMLFLNRPAPRSSPVARPPRIPIRASGLSQDGLAQIGFAQVDSAQDDPVQVGFKEIRRGERVFGAPGVPDPGSLLENREVLLVRHALRLLPSRCERRSAQGGSPASR